MRKKNCKKSVIRILSCICIAVLLAGCNNTGNEAEDEEPQFADSLLKGYG